MSERAVKRGERRNTKKRSNRSTSDVQSGRSARNLLSGRRFQSGMLESSNVVPVLKKKIVELTEAVQRKEDEIQILNDALQEGRTQFDQLEQERNQFHEYGISMENYVKELNEHIVSLQGEIERRDELVEVHTHHLKTQQESIEWLKAVGERHCDEVAMLHEELTGEKLSVVEYRTEMDKLPKLFHLATQLRDQVFRERYERSLLWKDNRRLIQLLAKTDQFGNFARWYKRQDGGVTFCHASAMPFMSVEKDSDERNSLANISRRSTSRAIVSEDESPLVSYRSQSAKMRPRVSKPEWDPKTTVDRDLFASYSLNKRNITNDPSRVNHDMNEADPERKFWVPVGAIVEVGNFCAIRNHHKDTRDITMDLSELPDSFDTFLSDNSALVSIGETRAVLFNELLLKLNKSFVKREARSVNRAIVSLKKRIEVLQMRNRMQLTVDVKTREDHVAFLDQERAKIQTHLSALKRKVASRKRSWKRLGKAISKKESGLLHVAQVSNERLLAENNRLHVLNDKLIEVNKELEQRLGEYEIAQRKLSAEVNESLRQTKKRIEPMDNVESSQSVAVEREIGYCEGQKEMGTSILGLVEGCFSEIESYIERHVHAMGEIMREVGGAAESGTGGDILKCCSDGEGLCTELQRNASESLNDFRIGVRTVVENAMRHYDEWQERAKLQEEKLRESRIISSFDSALGGGERNNFGGNEQYVVHGSVPHSVIATKFTGSHNYTPKGMQQGTGQLFSSAQSHGGRGNILKVSLPTESTHNGFQ